MSQFHTADGRHGFRLYDEYGKRISKLLGSKQASIAMEALKVFQIAQAKAALKHYATESTLTLSDGLDIWFAGKDMRASTRKTQPAMMMHFRRELGKTPLHHVTPQILAGYCETRREQTAPSTFCLEKRLIRALFVHLKETGAAPTNPAASIKGTYTLATRARALTRDEELRLITSASPRTLPRFLLALDAGLHVSELLSLRVTHVNLKNRILQVWPTTGRSYAGKTPYRTRALPMTGRLQTVLTELCAELAPDAPLFDLTRPTSFLQGFAPAVGIKFRFHDLRHTFATRLMEAGAPENIIAAALGHAPRRNTTAYCHVTLDHLTLHFARMESLAMRHAEGTLTREDLFPIETPTERSEDERQI